MDTTGPRSIEFDEMNMLPGLCIVGSRSECDVSIQFGPHKFSLPVIPSNMRTVLDERVARLFANAGVLYVMHRFDTDNPQFVGDMQSDGLIASISLGVKPEDYAIVDALRAARLTPDYVTVDIAHGHALSMQRILGYVKEKLPDSFLIAGNVATPEAVSDLESWGADATKIGIGPGLVCTTYNKTRCGTAGWHLGSVRWCTEAATKPTIADGGIREHGDIALAVGFGGADMVMFGSLFAGYLESPGSLVEQDGRQYKEYFGSASEHNRPNSPRRHVEGKRLLTPYKPRSLTDLIIEMQEDMQSDVSYGGGRELADLAKARYFHRPSERIYEGFRRPR